MNEHGYCPSCNADLDGGSIWQHFFELYGDENKADEIAAMYGASRERGQWGRQIGQYDTIADRTVSWMCPDCSHEWSKT